MAHWRNRRSSAPYLCFLFRRGCDPRRLYEAVSTSHRCGVAPKHHLESFKVFVAGTIRILEKPFGREESESCLENL